MTLAEKPLKEVHEKLIAHGYNVSEYDDSKFLFDPERGKRKKGNNSHSDTNDGCFGGFVCGFFLGVVVVTAFLFSCYIKTIRER